MAIDTPAKRLSALSDGSPWEFGPPFPTGSTSQGDQQNIAFTYSGILAGGDVPPVEVVEPDLTNAIRDAILASACSAELATYLGTAAVFSRVPVPHAAPYPMVVITTAGVREEDGINDFRPLLTYNIAVSGKNEVAAHYRTVSDIAYCIRRLFHRQRNLSIDEWGTVDQRCVGPVDQPSAGQITTRVVTLNVRIAQQVA